MAEDVEQAVAAAHQQEREQVRPPRVDDGGGDHDAERLHERHHDGDDVAHGRDAAQLVAQRADRHRPGVEALGRQDVGQQRRRAGPSSCAPASPPCPHHTSDDRRRSTAVTYARRRGRRSARSTPARSCCRCCSASTRRCSRPGRSSRWPSCSASPPARCARRCRGWSPPASWPSTATATASSGRLLERKAAQDIGRRPAPGAWDGTWIVAVVTAPRRVDRRRGGPSARTWPTCGWASCGPDTWLRPANLAGPDRRRRAGRRARPARRRGPGALAGPALAAAGDRGRRADALDAAGSTRCSPALADRRPDALPPTITLAAEVVRFLRAEPLLPPALTPQPWPPDDAAATATASSTGPSAGPCATPSADHRVPRAGIPQQHSDQHWMDAVSAGR